MRKNKWLIIAVLVVAAGVWFFAAQSHKKASNGEVTVGIHPARGTIQTYVSTTGTVLPKNRLEIKPSVNGRVDSILVQEGDQVKSGQVLAWMSSTERTALLDAARGQDEKTLKYWQDVYKPIPLFSPIDGEVIVATTQPAQTVTTADAVLVLSDHLIVRAQVDETDIGKIALGQEAVVTLDAYPDTKIKATVEHLYYESKTVNNVTIYEVDLLPDSTPAFFRSGMNASIDFKTAAKENILTLPVGAVHTEKGQSYVLVNEAQSKEPVKKPVTLGITDDKKVEIVSGVDEGDTVLEQTQKYQLPQKSAAGKNPFLPQRPQGRGGH